MISPLSTEAMWTQGIPRPTCPACGLVIGKVAGPHQCLVPKLIAAIGVELTDEERRFVKWLAKHHDGTAAMLSILAKVKDR